MWNEACDMYGHLLSDWLDEQESMKENQKEYSEESKKEEDK